MARFNVVLTDTAVPDYDLEEAAFRDSGMDVGRVYLHTRDPEEVVGRAADADADALIVSWAPITRDVIARLPRLRVIARYGIGVDMIDLDAATDHGVLVCNTARYCIDEVSTHAIALLLALNRHLVDDAERLRAGGWGAAGAPPRRLRDQQLGLVGLGNIGRAAGRKALGLGMRIVAYDPFVRERHDEVDGIELVEFDELLRSSDFVSLHIPLNATTHHLVGAHELGLMPPHAALINTARGGLVDQAALTDALAARRIAGAGLDVFEQEPLPPHDPLRAMPHVILTPHSAHWSRESTEECRATAVDHVLTVLRGGIPSDVVNRAVLQRDNRRV